MFAQVEGVNLLEETKTLPYDIHCPLMASVGVKHKTLNYWKSKCLIRNRDKLLEATCYPKCKMVKPRTIKVLDRNITQDKIIKGQEWLILRESGVLMKDIAKRDDVSATTVWRYICAARLERSAEEV